MPILCLVEEGRKAPKMQYRPWSMLFLQKENEKEVWGKDCLKQGVAKRF